MAEGETRYPKGAAYFATDAIWKLAFIAKHRSICPWHGSAMRWVSCRVVYDANMTARLVTDALILAIWRPEKPDALLRHPDQESQYIGRLSAA